MDDTGLGAGRRVAAVGIPAVAVVGLALWLTAPDRAPEPSPAEPEAAAAPPEAAPPAGESGAAPARPAVAPAFDVVRVEPGGTAVVAGTAEPGAQVTIYADAAPLAQATADAEGNFVAIFEAPPAATPRALTLGATTAGGAPVTSDDVVLLLPPAPEPLASAPELEREPEPEPEVAATAILRDDSVEVTPTEPGPAADRDVSLGSISYAEAGDVTLAGLGAAGSVLRVYVDDTFAREARVGDDGRWIMELADIAGGVYTLRIDQLDADGRVSSRIETPFQRDFPRAPPPRPEGPGATDLPGEVTVQPGHNLWTLARMHYGSGVLYTQIHTANRALIRDPNLIYPGQIFELPEFDEAD